MEKNVFFSSHVEQAIRAFDKISLQQIANENYIANLNGVPHYRETKFWEQNLTSFPFFFCRVDSRIVNRKELICITIDWSLKDQWEQQEKNK